MCVLTLVAGLPGSGKSTLLEASNYDVVYDDFYATQPVSEVKGLSANKNPLQNGRFSQLVTDLLAHRNVAVSDIAFCVARHRNEFLAAIFTAVPEVEVQFIFFENDPEKAKRNVERRNREDHLEKERHLIAEITSRYSKVSIEVQDIYDA